MMPDLTWSCHICHKERPDEFISVLTKPLIVNGVEMGGQNIRYCNDNITCWIAAQSFNFVAPTDANGDPIEVE